MDTIYAWIRLCIVYVGRTLCGALCGIQFHCDPDEMLVRVWCGVRLEIAVDRRSIQIMLMEWQWVFAYCTGEYDYIHVAII